VVYTKTIRQRSRVVYERIVNEAKGFAPPVDVCEFKNEIIELLDLNKQHDL
jgi:hypothetical protein